VAGVRRGRLNVAAVDGRGVMVEVHERVHGVVAQGIGHFGVQIYFRLWVAYVRFCDGTRFVG
jgi:hypothetical protein